MNFSRTLYAAFVVALAALVQPSAAGHAALTEPPCHETLAIAAEGGQPCSGHAAAPDMACCVSASCAAPAWAAPASADCPQPIWAPAPAASARLRPCGEGILLRPVLPPPRAA